MRNSKMTAFKLTLTAVIGLISISDSAVAQEKSKLEKALRYKPFQKTVDYDSPTAEEIKSCRLEKTIDKFKKPGFAVYDPSGRLLRLFFDVNRDNNLDSWSYFKDGIEVYRDIDTDFDSRADEFRWLGSVGIRRGKDADKNGTIDNWLMISASEVAEEVFHAVRTSDSARFKKLLVTGSELKKLNLGDDMSKVVTQSVREASAKFDSFVSKQKVISSKSRWTQFGSTRPSLVPKGQSGLKNDLIIFDHAAAVFENKGKYGQLSLGTIVEISPNNWRVLQLPELVGEGQIVKNGGLFYPAASTPGETQIAAGGDNAETQALVKLFEKYDTLETKIKKATGAAKIAQLEEERAKLFIQLATESKELEERQNWARQMADTVTSAYQVNKFPKGISFLEAQIPKLKSLGLADQIPYVQWRIIYAKFLAGHQDGDRRARTKANEKYISDLTEFVSDYPKSSFSADAMFQLGLNAEVSERDEGKKAVKWYSSCRKAFPNTLFGKKAAGALVRLTSQGKPLPLNGTTLNGKKFDLKSSQLRGKIVIVHYWETQCDTCIDGFEELQRLSAKYKSDIQVIGANLDDNVSKVKSYLSKNRSVNWPHLHAPGGAEKSPLAIQLGVATLPLTILVDQRGNLVESNVPVDDLDREIQRLIRRESGQANLRKSTR